MFNFIKHTLQKIYHTLTGKLSELFARKKLDAHTLQELELLLISADTGVKTTRSIIDALQRQYAQGLLQEGGDLKKALSAHMQKMLHTPEDDLYNAPVYLLVGINGSGKTTCAAKLARHSIKQNQKVLLAAADTFRAAAVEQLSTWAALIEAEIVTGTAGQDPAAVVFKACQQFKENSYQTLIIDTAGRLQTKAHLMKELEKIKRTISKQLPDRKIVTLLTIDSMLGQNSFEQAKLFHESTHVDGIILTKMDGTGKGGIVFAINQELNIPVAYISFGEKIEQIHRFDAAQYVHDLLG